MDRHLWSCISIG